MAGRRLSVLYFSNSGTRSGAEEHILTLARGLDRRRFRVLLVADPNVLERMTDLPADVQAMPLAARRPTDLKALWGLARIIREQGIDVVHAHLFVASLVASPVAWACGVPVVVETPHCREQWRSGLIKSRFFVDRIVGLFVSRWIAVSEANARYLREDKGLPSAKVVTILNGCDIERFDPARPAPSSLKAGLGFGPEDVVYVMVGRLEPQKGHATLLESLALARREEPAIRLVCVGEGGLRGGLEAQAARLGLGESVRFVGYQKQVDDWLALADATVLPSLYEGLPLVAIESLAAARPVIATAVDGNPEVVRDGYTGLLVPVGDAPALSQALVALARDPERRRMLGSQGRAFAEEHFTESRQVRETEDLYLQAWTARNPAERLRVEEASA
jgi:glycosyltransferase involved in cell wall biosynthesis